MSNQDRTIDGVALVREQRSRIRDLSGFQKSHRVPTETNDRTQHFVGRIAHREISDDLDARFGEFRRHFAFRRVDLQVTEPDNGTGAICTPWFEYRITAIHADDDANEVVIRRQVTDFKETDALFSSEFAKVFGGLFDTVEFEPPEEIDVERLIDRLEDRTDSDLNLDYDRTATWCIVSTQDIPGRLQVAADRIALVTNQPDLPARLLEAFFQFRTSLHGIGC